MSRGRAQLWGRAGGSATGPSYCLRRIRFTDPSTSSIYESHPLVTAPSAQLDVGHIPHPKRGGTVNTRLCGINGANQECLWDGTHTCWCIPTPGGHHLHASASSLTQPGQVCPFIGHHDYCKRFPASSWFCTLVLVLACCGKNVASRPLAYPGERHLEHMRCSRIWRSRLSPDLEACSTVPEPLSPCNWQDSK